MMTPDTRPLAGPGPGSAWQPARRGQSRPMNAGRLALVALPASPSWALRHARPFLDSFHGMSESTAETAELLVPELVTNAPRFSADRARTRWAGAWPGPEHAKAPGPCGTGYGTGRA